MENNEISESEIILFTEVQKLTSVGSYFVSAFQDDKQYRPDDWENTYQRYKEIKLKIFDVVVEIQDDFCFSAASHLIIDMLMKANEIEEAQRLLKYVEIDIIKQKIFESYPSLKKRWLSW